LFENIYWFTKKYLYLQSNKLVYCSSFHFEQDVDGVMIKNGIPDRNYDLEHLDNLKKHGKNLSNSKV